MNDQKRAVQLSERESVTHFLESAPSLQSGSSKRSSRKIAIITAVRERRSMGLDDLVRAFGVSPATIRRDLADLEDQGLLARTHGGARTLPASEVPVGLRDAQYREAKTRIARCAATLLPEGPCVVAIGGGTTAAGVARALMFRNDLTVVTNSVTTASEIGGRPNLTVVVTGGVVRGHSLELVGALAESTFNAVTVGTAILGMDGVSAAGGATTHDGTEARTNSVMARRAQRVVVVADSSKIGRVTTAWVAGLDDVDDLVTDDAADPDELDRIRRHGVRVHTVAVPGLPGAAVAVRSPH
ncbi:DeoR/GlpR transcriptional regulator [Curtobacterium herbarum]|nr:DeoR/GlpR transcriptional regulator [Curtobacterium herbarum]